MSTELKKVLNWLGILIMLTVILQNIIYFLTLSELKTIEQKTCEPHAREGGSKAMTDPMAELFIDILQDLGYYDTARSGSSQDIETAKELIMFATQTLLGHADPMISFLAAAVRQFHYDDEIDWGYLASQ